MIALSRAAFTRRRFLAGTAALTAATRQELEDAPGLWDELIRRVAAPAAEPAPNGEAAVRPRSSDPSR